MTNVTHYPPKGTSTHDRHISCSFANNMFWSTIQVDRDSRNDIVLACVEAGSRRRRSLTIQCKGYCHKPVVCADARGVFVAWNEVENGEWAIRFVRVDPLSLETGPVETVFSQSALCLAPSLCLNADVPWLAFPCSEKNRIRIRTAFRGQDGKWKVSGPVSSGAYDAFRPVLSTFDDGAVLAWHQYDDSSCGIAVGRLSVSGYSEIASLSEQGERWLCPSVAVGAGVFWVTWVALREVCDDLGIYDHFPLAMVARGTMQGVEIVKDPSSAEDPVRMADFRDGLLGAWRYEAHFGLRRNPGIATDSDGVVWLTWESRPEQEDHMEPARLLGRKLMDNIWSSPVVLHENGYCYWTPREFPAATMPVAFLERDRTGEDPVVMDLVEIKDCRDAELASDKKWSRWHGCVPERLSKIDDAISSSGREYRLFWADTHCHSVISPDAEGEEDEIICFARDIAGIDAVCVADNDFYPYKGLSEAEWRVHGEMARRFTEPGRFVVFPGYEYTYHRKDLNPDFNHRIVFYPNPGGPILRRHDEGSTSDRELFDKLKQTSAMCYPHHTTYEIVDETLDRCVEICSSWRVCMEEVDFTMNQLKAGHRFGFIGSSDSHRSVPGLGGALTCVYAEELTPESMFEAYRNRRTTATQGFSIFIDFRVNDVFIGGEGESESDPVIEWRVKAFDPIASIELVRDGVNIHVREPKGTKDSFEFADKDAGKGEHFYFLRVRLEGDPSFNIDSAQNSNHVFDGRGGRYPNNFARARGVFAWTSPVWMRRV